jgi:sirohydrochlorin ferrochelatase
LLHSSKIPAEALDGRAADVLEPFLTRLAERGARDFLAVPLFFGPSRALTSLIPQTAARVSAGGSEVQVRVAEALCLLPEGEPRLAEILDRAIRHALSAASPKAGSPPIALLVDHGSPIPEVTAVRHWIAGQLERLSAGSYRVLEAAMERRPGPEYAFNGALLAEMLERIGQASQPAQVIVAMQFIGPGRHAGSGGDVVTICQQAQQRYPDLSITISRLVGEDDVVVDILADRALAALSDPSRAQSR